MDRDIMIKVNIFSPVYHRFSKTMISLNSIIESINQSQHDVKLFVGINGVENDSMRNWLNNLPNNTIRLFNSSRNIGKAAIVNYMVDNVEEADYFISIDSDMVARENDKYNWIDELVKIMEFEPAQNFGLLSTWQDGNNCHLLDKLNERTEFLGQHIRYGEFYGVAGGCFIMRDKEFKWLGKYQVIDIYNGDDALLMQNINRHLQKLIGVTENIKLEHIPNYPEEQKYQQWKIDKCYGKLPIGKHTKGFWDK